MSYADDLLALARELSNATTPRQAHLKRAVSTAYYALFNAIVVSAATRFVGSAKVDRPAYGLFARAYDHRRMIEACSAVEKPVMPASAQAYFGRSAATAELRTVAFTFVLLQNARHAADYDPKVSVTPAGARKLVDAAEVAMGLSDAAPDDDRTDFLAYLLAQPRR